jgi:hypothetical protein
MQQQLNLPCLKIKEQYLSGLSLKTISKMYNCSESAIRSRLIEMDVKMKPRGCSCGLYWDKEISSDLCGFLIGMGMGDTHFANSRKMKIMCTEHSQYQEEYLLWKYSKIKNVVGGHIYKRDRFDKRTNKIYHSISHHSNSHPIINELYSEFLKNGNTKQITNKLLDRLTPDGIAVWFCDDGCLYRYPKGYLNQLSIAVNSYDTYSRELIINMFKEKYNISFSENMKNGSMRLCNIQGIKKFYNHFGKYIPECMNYKKWS